MIKITMAFETLHNYNRLDERYKVDLINAIMQSSNKISGLTMDEHMGSYRMDNGDIATEYSYSFIFFDDEAYEAIKGYLITLGKLHNQESIIIEHDDDTEFIYMSEI